MKATKVYIFVSALCTASIAGNLLSSVVFAQQAPAVRITQSAQNQTTNSALTDANDETSAVQAKTGDIIKYVAAIKNTHENDTFTSAKFISAVPNGSELVSDASKREINEDIGSIGAGKTITKEFLVKITSTKNGDIIENKICYTGQFEAKNQAGSDCESAFVKVMTSESATPTTPAPAPTTPTPAPHTTPPQPAPSEDHTPRTPTPAPAGNTTKDASNLPTTGPEDIIAPATALGVSTIVYAGHLFVSKRRGA